MLRTAIRRYSAANSLAEWTAQVTAKTHTIHDVATLNKARQLSLCLPHPKSALDTVVQKGDTASALALDSMPIGSEMVLFNPLLAEDQLGHNGTERTFGPPGDLEQRMWAGGSFTWYNQNPLQLGDEVQCDVAVDKVEPKQGAQTGQMVLVWRRLEYSNARGKVATEKRCHIYRSARKTKYAPAAKTEEEREADFGWDYPATRAVLFRYSAVTFNAHRIHLDPQYCRDEEGHHDCLVHGPLTATLLMNLVAKAAAKEGQRLSSFDYRATAPLTVAQMVRLRGQWSTPGQADLWALNEQGTVCMRANATVS